MGNQESSRRVSFTNDQSDHVVQVSRNVVIELIRRSEEDGGSQKYKSNAQNTVLKEGSAVHDPDYQDFTFKTLENDPIYQTELQRTTEYWQERTKELKESHERINKIWQTEYQRALDEVDEFFGKLGKKSGKTPCSTEKSKVLACYKNNAKQTLMCCKEIKSFMDCMNGGKA